MPQYTYLYMLLLLITADQIVAFILPPIKLMKRSMRTSSRISMTSHSEEMKLLLKLFQELNSTITSNRKEDLVKWKNMENSIASMNSTINNMENSIASINSTINNMENSIASMNSTISSNRKEDLAKWKNMEPIWNSGGRTFELVVRENLRRKFGDDFVRPFDVTSLNGLARMSLPKGYILPSEGMDAYSSSDSAFRLQSRTDKLVAIAQQHLPGFKSWVDTSMKSSDKGTKKKAYDAFQRLKRLDASKDQSKFLSFDPVGLFLFSREALKVPYEEGYLSSAEFDCRGTVKVFGNSIHFEIAEIKSSVGLENAIVQLLKRYSLLHAATRALTNDEAIKKPFNINMHGWVIGASPQWQAPTDEEINRLTDVNGLSLPEDSVTIEVAIM
jgi:hypothetical protein